MIASVFLVFFILPYSVRLTRQCISLHPLFENFCKICYHCLQFCHSLHLLLKTFRTSPPRIPHFHLEFPQFVISPVSAFLPVIPFLHFIMRWSHLVPKPILPQQLVNALPSNHCPSYMAMPSRRPPQKSMRLGGGALKRHQKQNRKKLPKSTRNSPQKVS